MKADSILRRLLITTLVATTAIPSPNACEALQIAPATAAAGAWTWYKGALAAQPLVTKSITSSYDY